MRSLKAISLAPSGKDWLANSNQPRLLHVFEQACNLINERKEVLSVVTPQIGNGPFNLVVGDNISFSQHLNSESRGSVSANRLTVGKWTVEIADAILWSARLDWEMLHAERELVLDGLVACLDARKQEKAGSSRPPEGAAPGLSKLLPGIEQAASPPGDRILPVSILSGFSSALAKADISSACHLATQLAGLGIGLTPMGDDFIMGAMYAAWIIHPLEIASVLAGEIADTAAPLTTSLSGAWLRSAGRGEAGVLWHQFFAALVSANAMQVENALNRILGVGATSGADALAGFAGAFQAWASLDNPEIL